MAAQYSGSTIQWQHNTVAVQYSGSTIQWQHNTVAAQYNGSTIQWQHSHKDQLEMFNVEILGTAKPVLSDHIKQDKFFAFQTGGCLLLHESSAESTCMSFLHYFHSAISSHQSLKQFPCHLNGWSLITGLTVCKTYNGSTAILSCKF